jgi:hypothetical protein
MRRLRRPTRHPWLTLLVVLLGVLFVVYVVPTPWALHIGNRFTPTERWDGYALLSASNGGRYVLFTHLEGGILGGGENEPSCSFHGCDTLHGSAKLCTEGGRTYSLELSGAVHSWWSTDGASTSIDLTGSNLPDGWVVAFHGKWHGTVLPLADTDDSFTEVFTPAGTIRHVTSTADAGTASGTLRYGSGRAFAAACHALAAGRG